MTPIIVRLDDLKTHPAQMRTTYSLPNLAELIIQILHQGLHAWQPILIGKNGSDKAPIISGHRRHLATTFSHYLPLWLKEQGQDVQADDITISHARQMLEALVTHENHFAFASDVETAVSEALTHVGTVEISVQIHPEAGNLQAEMMALIASNYGGEAPDILGEAVAFQAAMLDGQSAKQIANSIGKPVKYVTDRVALVNIDAELAKCIVRGKFSLTAATAVAGIENLGKKAGLTRYLLAKQDELSIGEITTIAKTLKAWQGLIMPLLFAGNQTQRNMARILIRMWHNALESYPESSWAAAAMFIHRQAHLEPWLNQAHFTLWVKSFGNGIYFIDDAIVWDKLIHELLTEVSCATCPLAAVPALPNLKNQITTRGGPLGMPCRLGEKGNNCLHGFLPKDAIQVRVPAAWAGLDGVAGDAGAYTVTGVEAFEAAEAAQLAREQAEAAEANAKADAAAAEAKQQSSVGSNRNADSTAKKVESTGKKPIQKKRDAIILFMETHEQLAATHPWATLCATCQNRREDSPVKDPNVPHCNWGKGGSSAYFNVWLPKQDGDKGPHIPYCRQYLPTAQWKDVVPATPAPQGMTREWLIDQIKAHYAKAVSTSGSLDEERPLLFLFGRTTVTSESNRDWFNKQFKKQSGELTDDQLWTLCIWIMNRWNGSSREQLFPVLGNGSQLVPYKLVDYGTYAKTHTLQPPKVQSVTVEETQPATDKQAGSATAVLPKADNAIYKEGTDE